METRRMDIDRNWWMKTHSSFQEGPELTNSQPPAVRNASHTCDVQMSACQACSAGIFSASVSYSSQVK